MAHRHSTTRGFKRTASILSDQVRKAGESRGFAVSRVLTHWAEIAGPAMAEVAHPVEISYGRGGFGATLTILTTGAQAPMVEMEKEKLRERLNAAYGYNAIARIRITQTAPTGFAEGKIAFAPRKPAPQKPLNADEAAGIRQTVTPVRDSGLRAALERLGSNVLIRSKQ